MNVHVIQTAGAGGDPSGERPRVAAAVKAAGPRAGDMVLLPELATTSYRRELQEDERAVAALHGVFEVDLTFYGALAKEFSIHLLAGCLDTGDGKGRWKNFAVAFSPEGREVLRYQKIHPFSFSGEDRAFVGGHRVPLWQVGDFVIQPVICYDLRFPELFRWHLNAGVNAFAVIANWPLARLEQWNALLTARAIENQAFVFAANAGGRSFDIPWAGGSCVIHPKGHRLAFCGQTPGHGSAEIDAREVTQWRGAFPVLQDRKPGSFYTGNE